MRTLHNILSKILAVVSIIFFAAMVIVTVWQVFTRQVLNDPSAWSEELARLLFVWLTFLGGAFLFGERGHIAVDFLARRLPGSSQRYAQAFVQVMVLAFALVGMVWGGIVASSNAWNQNLTALPFTIGWIYIVIPISGVLIALFAVSDLVGVLTGKVEPYPDPDVEEDEGVAPTHPEQIEEESVLDGSARSAGSEGGER